MTRTVLPGFSVTWVKLRSQRWSGSAKVTDSAEELVFGVGKMQLDPHAAIEACFGKQQVAPGSAAAKTEIATAGPDLVERSADTCCRRLDL